MSDTQMMKQITIGISIPTVEIDAKGNRTGTMLDEEELSKKIEGIEAEMEDLDLPNILRTVMQGILEEQFLKERLIAEVQ